MTLKRNPITVRYKIQNSVLEKVDTIRDLGVWLDSKLTFAEHINITVNKANRALGVMIRSLQIGHTSGGVRRKLKPEPILAAYFGNIRSIMEFGCVIWGGAAKTHLDRLEKIQHKFLIWLASVSTRNSASLSYSDLLESFKITTLANRRIQYDILFAHKLLLGKIDSALLLGSFPLHVPARNTRAMSRSLLHVPFARVDCVRRGLFCRLVANFNSYLAVCPESDPFSCSFEHFRSLTRSYIRQLPLP